MPTIKILFSILLTLSFTSCFEGKSKNHGLTPFSKSQFSYNGVVEKSIQLKFTVTKESSTYITATVQTDYDYEHSLKYDWKLGENVSLLVGEKTGILTGLKKGVPVHIQIQVKGFDADTPRFVRFEVLGLNQERRIYADGVLSSNVQKSFEHTVQEIEAYKKENN
ncbi:MAG: hypothetical protein ACK41T_03340 [Pseudobdellovibrio sp.]